MTQAFARLAGAIGVAALTACAAVQELPEPSPELLHTLEKRGYRLGEAVRLVPAFSITGWNYLDEHHIEVDGGPGQVYLVRFVAPCRELAGADRIGYTASAGSFGRAERILVLDVGRRVECPVGELYKLERMERP